MKLTTDSRGNITLEQVYCGLILKTRTGNEYGVCMRDDTIEIMPIGDAPSARVVTEVHND